MRYYLLLSAGLLLAGCVASEQGPRPAGYVPTRADSTLSAANLPSVGKLVFRGNVTIQVAGPGSTQTSSHADNRKAGQRQGSAATAPGSTACNASKRSGGPPWWVYLLAAGAGAGLWEYISHRKLLGWLPWRVEAN